MARFDQDTIFEINNRKNKIINTIRDIDLQLLEEDDKLFSNVKQPLIFIISGVATGGKDLFIKYVTEYVNQYTSLNFPNLNLVYNISSIDEVKNIVDYMNKMDGSSKAANSIANKDDNYRTLLHDIKMLWAAFDDGPNLTIYNLINRIMNKHKKLGYNPTFIFVHNREANEIDKMQQHLIHSMGLIVISVGVIGHSNPKDFTNEGDSLANDYNYDIVIPNYKDKELLKRDTYLFVRNAMRANGQYGI